MNKTKLFDIHRLICGEALTLMEERNKDYACDVDPFRNLMAPERMGVCTGQKGVLIRMMDKFSRLVSHSDGDDMNESYRDDVIDLINYAILYHAMEVTKTLPEPVLVIEDNTGRAPGYVPDREDRKFRGGDYP